MSGTVAEILETPGEGMPFKVVFSSAGKPFAEHPVNSRLSADELIAAVLPVLQGFSTRWSALAIAFGAMDLAADQGVRLRMPRFFFHLRDESGFVQDEEGREFASLGEARVHALEGIRSIVSEDAKSGRIDLTGELEVADESGAAVLTLGFGEAVEINRPDKLPWSTST